MMLAIPAIDLRDGRCVLRAAVGGDPEDGQMDDPLTVARRWVAAGFARLHVADRGAATGGVDNRNLIRDLLRHTSVPVQVDGGGAMNEELLGSWLDDGAEFVVADMPGAGDPSWLIEQATLAPGRIILAADFRDRLLVSRSWNTGTRRTALDLIAELEDAPFGGLLLTAVRTDGRGFRTDHPLMEDVVSASPWPVIASATISSMQDLRNLEDLGASAAVIGRELRTDALDARLVAEEFAS